MEEFNADNIFTLPLVLGANCSDSADSHSVNGLQVELTDASNIVSKTLLVYQDTSILTSDNGEGQPVVRFLCEVEDNHEQNIDNCADNAQTNGLVDGPSETLSFTNNACSLRFTNGDLGETSNTLSYGMNSREALSSGDISDVVSVKSVDIDLLNGSLDAFIQTVVLFQCRLCQHASNDKSDIIRHLKSFHLINNTQKEGMVILKGGTDSIEIDIKREKTEDEKSAETQATVYMCGKCSLPFETMAECKSHMSNHPKAKGGSKVNGKAPKRDNQPKIVQLTRQTASEPKNEYVILRNVKEEEPTPVEEVNEGKDCPDLVKEKNFKCSKETCDLKFSTEDLMTLHSECHWLSQDPEEKAPYKCCRCHYTFKKWSELALHLWKSHHIDLDLFKCSVCTFKSVSRLELRRHFKNHAVGDFYCTVCGKSFVAEELFLAHSSAAHGLNPTSESEKKKKKKKVEECGECGMRLSSAKALKKHVKVVHGKLRPYVCQVCPFTSSTLATLQLHLRQHTGETPFTCDDCSFKTRDHNTMRRHRMRHSFVKPYSCKHCQFSSVQSTQLKNHILKFHPESTDVFECRDCSFTTLSESLMLSHRKVLHRNGRPNKISDEVDRDRNLSSMFPSSKNKEKKDESSRMEVEDEESSSQCYFESEQHVPDTGGITIPAEETPKVGGTCGGESQLNDPGGGVQTGGVLVPNEDTMPLS